MFTEYLIRLTRNPSRLGLCSQGTCIIRSTWTSGWNCSRRVRDKIHQDSLMGQCSKSQSKNTFPAGTVTVSGTVLLVFAGYLTSHCCFSHFTLTSLLRMRQRQFEKLQITNKLASNLFYCGCGEEWHRYRHCDVTRDPVFSCVLQLF